MGIYGRVGPRWLHFGGGSGIRTHDTLAGITVFKTVAFVHSAIPPRGYNINVFLAVALVCRPTAGSLPRCGPEREPRRVQRKGGYLVPTSWIPVCAARTGCQALARLGGRYPYRAGEKVKAELSGEISNGGEVAET